MPTKLSDRFLGGMADAGHRSSLRQLDAIELHRTGRQDGASRVQGEELGKSNGEPSKNSFVWFVTRGAIS